MRKLWFRRTTCLKSCCRTSQEVIELLNRNFSIELKAFVVHPFWSMGLSTAFSVTFGGSSDTLGLSSRKSCVLLKTVVSQTSDTQGHVFISPSSAHPILSSPAWLAFGGSSALPDVPMLVWWLCEPSLGMRTEHWARPGLRARRGEGRGL